VGLDGFGALAIVLVVGVEWSGLDCGRDGLLLDTDRL
jgi:hypothetical protein